MTFFEKNTKQVTLFFGVIFTFFIALLGYLLSLLPGFSSIGQLACAIVIAIAYRQFFGYPQLLRAGISFSSKYLLKIAIVLYGLKLNMNTILSDGLGLLFQDAIVIALVILVMIWLGERLKANSAITLLIAVGTGICGAAAIAAVAPIIKAKDEDTAISVGMIALIGTVFAIGYTILYPILPIDQVTYGIWSGTTLHEIAHVALAGVPAGEDGFAVALLAKLGRVFLLIPVCFILMYIVKRKDDQSKGKTKVEFPMFLIGFIILSFLGSYVFGKTIPVPTQLMDGIFAITTWLLTAAMVGLGLNVHLKDLRTKAMRPLIALTITSAALSIIVYVALAFTA